MSGLVINREDRFSHNEAHIVVKLNILFLLTEISVSVYFAAYNFVIYNENIYKYILFIYLNFYFFYV